jgi:N-acetylglucosaminyldiphosphoundecaprenol N-acetyl-beta-D-mannosaminyltransferase
VVALGAEKGQKWILKNKEKLNAPVISHLGAVINFVAGTVTRAPVFWQRFGLEWLWRVKQEPQLWQRYLSDGVKFLYLLSFKVLPLAIYDRILKMRYLGNSILLEQESPYLQQYLVQGELTLNNVDRFIEKLTDLIVPKETIFLDLSNLEYIDAAGIARLMLLQNAINNTGGKLFLKNVPNKLVVLLHLNNVLQRFNINN